MAGQPPNQSRNDEQADFVFRGPFGGIQTECPLDDIEEIGFADSLNMMFKHGVAFPRPPANPLILLPNPQEPFMGVADFFTLLGIRLQTVITPTRLVQWTGSAWTPITGTLSGSSSQLFTWSVVGGKLYFCQGVDKVKLWDGVAASFIDSSVNAVPAKYLFELDNHLIACNTIEGGVAATQRVRWTGIGDGTDWISFNAGQMDLFNDLGPITGGIKLYQSGYIFQQWGITQLIPTGIGINPFFRNSLSAHSKGCICPYSLAAFGEDMAAYVGKDNVYLFDGTSSEPIGERPLQGARRTGAWGAISIDLLVSNLNTVFAYLSSSINGTRAKMYWLFTSVSVWVYSFDEGNWTRFAYAKQPSIAGTFNKNSSVRIIDLVGLISQQNWSPASLTGANPLDQMFIGFNDGTPGVVDFTGTCESTASLTSGQCYFGDRRHTKTLKRFLLTFTDKGPVTFTMKVTNEKGFSQSQSISAGSGSGAVLKKQIPGFNISGHYLTWILSVPPNQPTQIVEIRPIYDIGGDFREAN